MTRRDFVRMTACGVAAGATLFLPRLSRAALESASGLARRFDLVIAGGALGVVGPLWSSITSLISPAGYDSAAHGVLTCPQVPVAH